jgi:hypothetical protein
MQLFCYMCSCFFFVAFHFTLNIQTSAEEILLWKDRATKLKDAGQSQKDVVADLTKCLQASVEELERTKGSTVPQTTFPIQEISSNEGDLDVQGKNSRDGSDSALWKGRAQKQKQVNIEQKKKIAKLLEHLEKLDADVATTEAAALHAKDELIKLQTMHAEDKMQLVQLRAQQEAGHDVATASLDSAASHAEAIAKLKIDVEAKDARCEQLGDEAAQAGSSVAELEQEAVVLRREVEDLTMELAQTGERGKNVEGRLAELAVEIQEAVATLEASQEENAILTAQVQAAHESAQDRVATIATLEEEVVQLRFLGASHADVELELEQCKLELEKVKIDGASNAGESGEVALWKERANKSRGAYKTLKVEMEKIVSEEVKKISLKHKVTTESTAKIHNSALRASEDKWRKRITVIRGQCSILKLSALLTAQQRRHTQRALFFWKFPVLAGSSQKTPAPMLKTETDDSAGIIALLEQEKRELQKELDGVQEIVSKLETERDKLKQCARQLTASSEKTKEDMDEQLGKMQVMLLSLEQERDEMKRVVLEACKTGEASPAVILQDKQEKMVPSLSSEDMDVPPRLHGIFFEAMARFKEWQTTHRATLSQIRKGETPKKSSLGTIERTSSCEEVKFLNEDGSTIMKDLERLGQSVCMHLENVTRKLSAVEMESARNKKSLSQARKDLRDAKKSNAVSHSTSTENVRASGGVDVESGNAEGSQHHFVQVEPPSEKITSPKNKTRKQTSTARKLVFNDNAPPPPVAAAAGGQSTPKVVQGPLWRLMLRFVFFFCTS